MSVEPKVEIVGKGTTMHVACSDGEFAKIRQAICNETGYAEDASQVWYISVTDASRRPKRPASRLSDRIALVGCAAIAFPILFVFVAGVARIIEMFRK
jgi:hypothetical protein